MKTQNYPLNSYYKSQPSFKGKKLAAFVMKRTLGNGENKPIQLFLTKLDGDDVGQLFAERQKLKESRYGFWVFRDFIDSLQKRLFGREFLVLESLPERTLKSSIKALCSIIRCRDWTEVEILQKIDSSIKGSGAVLLYSICKLAKNANHRFIELIAARKEVVDYYKKLGFQNIEGHPNEFRLILYNGQFDSFMQNIRKKYLS